MKQKKKKKKKKNKNIARNENCDPSGGRSAARVPLS
jgi:hypothetical protein